MVQKHVAFAPRNKWGQINGAWPHLFPRLRYLLLTGEIAQPVLREAKESSSLLATLVKPFSRFFHPTALAKLGREKGACLLYSHLRHPIIH